MVCCQSCTACVDTDAGGFSSLAVPTFLPRRVQRYTGTKTQAVHSSKRVHYNCARPLRHRSQAKAGCLLPDNHPIPPAFKSPFSPRGLLQSPFPTLCIAIRAFCSSILPTCRQRSLPINHHTPTRPTPSPPAHGTRRSAGRHPLCYRIRRLPRIPHDPPSHP